MFVSPLFVPPSLPWPHAHPPGYLGDANLEAVQCLQDGLLHVLLHPHDKVDVVVHDHLLDDFHSFMPLLELPEVFRDGLP